MRLRAYAGSRLLRVLAPGNVAHAEVSFGLRTVYAQQRAHNPFRGDRQNAGQPASAAAAQKAEQDRLGLVRTRVAERDTISQSVAQAPEEELAPGFPARLFQVRSALRRTSRPMSVSSMIRLQPQPSGHFPNEERIFA